MQQHQSTPLLQKLQARGAIAAHKCYKQRTKQADTAEQAKAKICNNIAANIEYLQTQDGNIEFVQLYTLDTDGNYKVAAKYGNSYLHNWLDRLEADGTISKTTYLECTDAELVQTLELLKECIEDGHADEAIAKVQKQNAEAGRKRAALRLQGKRVKVQG